MEKYALLLGYQDKQWNLISKLYSQVVVIDLANYDSRYVFAFKTQQLYTAIEDLFKQIAKAFENHIKDLAGFHKELLVRMLIDIPTIRPKVLSESSYLMLDKVHSFRHFVRHAYDCELLENELRSIQNLMRVHFDEFQIDIFKFREFVLTLIQ